MKNVLMFYDDAIIIDLVRISLQDKGVNIVGLLNTEELISKIELHNPIAVILDLNMALELQKEVVDSLKSMDVPTIIFSSNLKGRRNAEERFSHFVRKSPFGFEELEKLIESVLAKESIAA